MKRILPPLNSLQAFESSAEHLSFTKAADELCVTQGAISKQVKLLESFLGTALFIRTSKELTLTDAGKDYYANITIAMDTIEDATKAINNATSYDDTLTVNVLPSLSTCWLIPMISDFKDQHPDLKIRIITGSGFSINMKELNADIAIRGNNTPFEGAENEKLFDEEMALVCSPDLIKDNTNISIGDICNYTLLEHSSRTNVWPNWMKSAGLPYAKIEQTLSFEHFFMLAGAAKNGLGFALIPQFLIQRSLDSGRLINPFNITYKTDFSYYLLYPKKHHSSKKVIEFNTWLKNKIHTP